MMFDEILQTLSENGKSGRAYGKVIELTSTAMKEDPSHATGYLLMSVLAERFMEGTGRLPITTLQVENAFEDFSKNANSLKDAYASGDFKSVEAALNKVSHACIKLSGAE